MRHTIFGLAALAALAGCDMSRMQSFNWGRQAETRPAPTQRQVDDLKAEMSTLRTENAALKEQVKELQIREKGLSAKAEKAQFIQQQQAEQIKVLAPAPGERDRALRQVEALTRQVEFLKDRNADLDRRIQVLAAANQAVAASRTPASAPGSTSAPATQPAQ